MKNIHPLAIFLVAGPGLAGAVAGQTGGLSATVILIVMAAAWLIWFQPAQPVPIRIRSHTKQRRN